MKIYDSVDNYPNRRIVFVCAGKDGEITFYAVSKESIMTNKSGHTFIVDDYVAEQITTFNLIDGGLSLKDGETLDEPVKSDVEVQDEELLRELADLRAQKAASAE